MRMFVDGKIYMFAIIHGIVIHQCTHRFPIEIGGDGDNGTEDVDNPDNEGGLALVAVLQLGLLLLHRLHDIDQPWLKRAFTLSVVPHLIL